jgi:GT2 family glycosyltransferase
MPDTLSSIAKKFEDESLAAVQTVYSKKTPIENFLSQYQNLYQHYNFNFIKDKYLSVLSSYCIAIKKKAFFDVGLFDETVKSATMEDQNLGIVLFAKGYKILLAKTILVEHLHYFNMKNLFKRMFLMGKVKAETLINDPMIRKMKTSKSNLPIALLISIILSPILLFMFISIFFWPFKLIFVALLASYILLNLHFFAFINKNKGLLFTIKSLFTYYIISLLVFIGLFYGSITGLIKMRL